MKIIGLTGGIATGKTTVSQMIRDMGQTVICADEIAHELVSNNSQILNQIISLFGKDYLDINQNLDRKKLASVIFKKQDLLKKLNDLLHPLALTEIQKKITEAKKKETKLFFIDVPLLFETGFDKTCDQTLLIYASPNVQMERLKKRDGFSEEEINLRLAAQWPIEKKRSLATFEIENMGSIEELKKAVKKLIEKL